MIANTGPLQQVHEDVDDDNNDVDDVDDGDV